MLDFWFLPVGAEGHAKVRREWFMGGPAFDAECKRELGELTQQAADEALYAWTTQPQSSLALVRCRRPRLT